MDKEKVRKTQEMWKDYPNAERWIKTIAEPAKHMSICDNEIVQLDPNYQMAVESLSYILLGKEIAPSLKDRTQ